MLDLVWLVVVVPLVSGLGLLVWGKEGDRVGHLVGTVASAASFVVGLVAFVQLLGRPEGDRSVAGTLFTWISSGPFHVDMAYRFDPLSALFVLLVTGVGTLIHVYSIGYMAHDERRRRFFAYLNLFVAAMLTLVLADDYLVLFLGWEGVGLASYLLIGFWQHKPSAAAAAKKAFVLNRVGDVGMALAIMLMFAQLGTSSIQVVNATVAGQASESVATALGLLLLLGACGKSAQVPLQAWLLDAMEGPTPVSALIHAATMVTAGVYLVVRSNGIFDAAPVAQTAVVVVGLVTLLAGAWIGCTKDDVKKALAGSTMSQIGYMVFAAGLGPIGYVYAIFHLLTHGVFKAGLFLGAGSVMHGMNDNVNMRRYGALRGVMGVTFVTFMAGYLAIIGIPPFAGFWSKDEIIHAAFERNAIIGAAAILAAGVTGFYMTRMIAMTFFGKKRWEDDAHPHESPSVMTIPLVLLALGSVFLGMALLFWGDIKDWLKPVVGYESVPTPLPTSFYIAVTLIVVIIGAIIGWVMYARRDVPIEAPTGNALTRAARQDLYGDAVNDVLVVQPTYRAAQMITTFDNKAVDGFVNWTGTFVGDLARRLRRSQSGFARSYALSMVGGALIVAIALVLVVLS